LDDFPPTAESRTFIKDGPRRGIFYEDGKEKKKGRCGDEKKKAKDDIEGSFSKIALNRNHTLIISD